MTKKSAFITLLFFLLPMLAAAAIPDIKFRRLDTRDGLSNSQVNSVLRDIRGNVWLGTQFGLCRYDGYRFKTFYSYERDTMTLRNNRIDEIQEAHDGRLWLDHGMNYSVYAETSNGMLMVSMLGELDVVIDDSETPADDDIEEAVMMDQEE